MVIRSVIAISVDVGVLSWSPVSSSSSSSSSVVSAGGCVCGVVPGSLPAYVINCIDVANICRVF